jgi:hypothetical protein
MLNLKLTRMFKLIEAYLRVVFKKIQRQLVIRFSGPTDFVAMKLSKIKSPLYFL